MERERRGRNEPPEISSHLPELVVIEILRRLPVKDLVRFTSVSKPWYSLITSQFFISIYRHETRARSKDLVLVRGFTYNSKKEHYPVHFDDDDDAFGELKMFDCPFMCLNPYLRVVGCVNGVVCLSNDMVDDVQTIILWNPSINKFVILPNSLMTNQSHGLSEHNVGFGFNFANNDYKVVRIVYPRVVCPISETDEDDEEEDDDVTNEEDEPDEEYETDEVDGSDEEEELMKRMRPRRMVILTDDDEENDKVDVIDEEDDTDEEIPAPLEEGETDEEDDTAEEDETDGVDGTDEEEELMKRMRLRRRVILTDDDEEDDTHEEIPAALEEGETDEEDGTGEECETNEEDETDEEEVLMKRMELRRRMILIDEEEETDEEDNIDEEDDTDEEILAAEEGETDEEDDTVEDDEIDEEEEIMKRMGPMRRIVLTDEEEETVEDDIYEDDTDEEIAAAVEEGETDEVDDTDEEDDTIKEDEPDEEIPHAVVEGGETSEEDLTDGEDDTNEEDETDEEDETSEEDETDEEIPPVVEIYELSTGSWRIVDCKGISYAVDDSSPQAYLNGVVHWMGSWYKMIVSFDIASEVFGRVEVPNSLVGKLSHSHCRITVLEERLSLVHFSFRHEKYAIWVMEQYGVPDSWTKRFSFDPPDHLIDSFGFMKNGGVLLQVTGSEDSEFEFPHTNLVSYSPQSKLLKDLGDLGSGEMYCVDNFVETLELLGIKRESAKQAKTEAESSSEHRTDAESEAQADEEGKSAKA